MRLRWSLIVCVHLFFFGGPKSCLAISSWSSDGRFFNFSSQNETYTQVLDTFREQTGIQYDIPQEMKDQRIPLVEIKGLTLKGALLKILEGSNFDFILISSPKDPENVRKLIVTGRSVQAVSPPAPGKTATVVAVAPRINRQAAVDPIGEGADMGMQDASSNDSLMFNPVPENAPNVAPPPIPGQPQQSTGQPSPAMNLQQEMQKFVQQHQQGNNPSGR